MSPAQLIDASSRNDAVALIPVRKFSDTIDHIVCVIGANSDSLEYIDYPEAKVVLSLASLREIWDGEVLLVERRVTSEAISLWWLWILPLALVGYCIRHSIRFLAPSAAFFLCLPACAGDGLAYSYELDRSSVDFGLVSGGSSNECVIVFRNLEKHPIELASGGVSCGCVSLIGLPATVEAGDESRFTVKLKVGFESGPVKQVAVLLAQGRRISIPVKAIVEGVWLSHQVIDLGRFSATEGSRNVVTSYVYSAAAGTRSELALQQDQEPVSTNLERADLPSSVLRRRFGTHLIDRYRLTLEVKPSSELEMISGKRTSRLLIVGSPKRTAYVVVHYEVSGLVDATPDRFFFGSVASGSRISREVAVQPGSSGQTIDLGEESLEIRVLPNYGFLKASLQPNNKIVLTASPTPKSDAGFFKGNVELIRPDQSSLCSIPFIGVLQASSVKNDD
ncbi:MAG: DUF1573 domain-containing protein [Planctomycetota bacterium]